VLQIDDNGEPAPAATTRATTKYSLRLMSGSTLKFASSWNGVQMQSRRSTAAIFRSALITRH
jgi:hypothetical protein